LLRSAVHLAEAQRKRLLSAVQVRRAVAGDAAFFNAFAVRLRPAMQARAAANGSLILLI
jgi:hypothetical protein